jgi:hypothetical protein
LAALAAFKVANLSRLPKEEIEKYKECQKPTGKDCQGCQHCPPLWLAALRDLIALFWNRIARTAGSSASPHAAPNAVNFYRIAKTRAACALARAFPLFG